MPQSVKKVYRSVDDSDTPESRSTDRDVMKRRGLSAPHVLRTVARILLFIKVAAHAPFDFLVVLAHARRS